MQGWVVRPGAQYGVDYVLYSKHPAEAHSSYCLLSLMGTKHPSLLSWNDVEAANRNSSQASSLRQPVVLHLHAAISLGVIWFAHDCISASPFSYT